MRLGLVGDVSMTLTSRPGRTGVRLIGLALGIAGMVAVAGLSASAARAVEVEFERHRASSVSLSVRPELRSELQPSRLNEFNGVQSSIRFDNWGKDRAVFVNGKATAPTDIFGTSQSFFDSPLTKVTWLGPRDIGDSRVIVGREFADLYGVDISGSTLQAIEIDGRRFSVAGVLNSTTILSDLLLGIVFELDHAEELFPTPKSSSLIVVTEARYTDILSALTPIAIWPADPSQVDVFVAADDRFLKGAVTRQARFGGYVASLVVLALGAANVATATAAEIRTRTSELGLRRALGASRRQIMILVFSETAVVGLLAGILGCWIGVATTVAVAAILNWEPLINPLIWLAFTLLGAVVGMCAGALPARAAAAISPREALIS